QLEVRIGVHVVEDDDRRGRVERDVDDAAPVGLHDAVADGDLRHSVAVHVGHRGPAAPDGEPAGGVEAVQDLAGRGEDREARVGGGGAEVEGAADDLGARRVGADVGD